MSLKVADLQTETKKATVEDPGQRKATQAQLDNNFRRTSTLFLGNLENITSDVKWVAGTAKSPKGYRLSIPTVEEDSKQRFSNAGGSGRPETPAHTIDARKLLNEKEEGDGNEHHYHVKESGGKIQIVYDEEETHRFIIPWNNKYRRAWDIVVVGMVLYLCFKIPFALAFDDYQFNYEFEMAMDIMFYIDIVLNFRTGFVHNGEHVTEPKEIAKHYLHTYLIFDLVASIPFGDLLSKNERKSLKMIKWLKIPKLLRVNRIIKQLKRYAKYYQLVMVLAALVLTIHLTGCMWMSLAAPCSIEEGKPCSPDLILLYYCVSLYLAVMAMFSVSNVFSFVSLVDRGISLYASGTNSTTTAAVHAASSLLGLSNSSDSCQSSTTLGEATFVDNENVSYVFPTTDYALTAWSRWSIFNEDEKLTVIGLYAVTIFATFCGSILLILLSSQAVVFAISGASRYHDFYSKVDLVKAEMSDARIPEDIQYKVARFYDYLWMNKKQGLGSNTSGMLHDPDLSKPLRKELALHLHGPLLASLKIFNGVSSDCLFAVAMKLKSHIYMPGDVIFLKGDVAHELYFIRRGTIKVLFGEVDPSLQLQTEDERLGKALQENSGREKAPATSKDVENSFKSPKDLGTEHVAVEEGELFKLMGPGSYFGEIALLTELPRVCTVKSHTMSELNELAKEDFEEAMLQFPELNDEVMEHAMATYPGLESHFRKLSVRIAEQREARRNVIGVGLGRVPVAPPPSVPKPQASPLAHRPSLAPIVGGEWKEVVSGQHRMSMRLDSIESTLGTVLERYENIKSENSSSIQ